MTPTEVATPIRPGLGDDHRATVAGQLQPTLVELLDLTLQAGLEEQLWMLRAQQG